MESENEIGFSGRFDELYKQLKAQGFNEKEMLESGLVIRNDRGQYIDMYRTVSYTHLTLPTT